MAANRTQCIGALAAAVLAALGVSSMVSAKAEYKITPAQLSSMAPDMQQQVAGLQYLLNGHQLKQLVSCRDDAERDAWLERFWLSQDPTPTTPKNEMLVEHTIRVNLSRQLFPLAHWPGWDRRGEVFIRYGPPGVRAKIPAEVTVRKTHAPGELWYYGRHGMVVVFRDESLTGNYIYAINGAGAIQDMNPELAEYLLYEADSQLENVVPAEFVEFYRAPETDPDATPPQSPVREAMDGPPVFKVIRPRMRGLSEDIGENMDPLTPHITPNNPAEMFHMDKAQKLANRFEETLEETPAAYPFNFESEAFPFFFDVGQFKAGEMVNRVEVNLEFPVDPASPDEVGERRIYRAAAVFWDADMQEVSRVEREIVVPVPAADAASRLMPAQLVFSLEHGYYRLAVSVSETRRVAAAGADSVPPHLTRKSSYRSSLSWRQYAGDLAISDILFAQKIAATDKQSPFIRGALEVVPHPVRRYPRGAPVPVYFELYGLGVNREGLSSYDIEYRIVPHSEKKKRFWDRFDSGSPVVSSRFRASGYNSDEPVHISIQSGNLAPGTYDLLVTIKDEHWQSTTYRRSTFRIVE